MADPDDPDADSPTDPVEDDMPRSIETMTNAWPSSKPAEGRSRWRVVSSPNSQALAALDSGGEREPAVASLVLREGAVALAEAGDPSCRTYPG
jgi:hypothetical protein